MYVLCDSSKSLRNSVSFNFSFTESICLFMKFYPKTSSLVVFQSYSPGKSISDLTFYCFMNERQIRNILSRSDGANPEP